jgi:hypothetical protein
VGSSVGATMVVEAAVLGGDQLGWWCGVMMLGCSGHFGSGRGALGGGMHAREVAVVASAIQNVEEDDWAVPACRRERAGWAGWASQGPRTSGRWR